MLSVPLNMGMSAAHCQGNVREFQSVTLMIWYDMIWCDSCAYRGLSDRFLLWWLIGQTFRLQVKRLRFSLQMLSTSFQEASEIFCTLSLSLIYVTLPADHCPRFCSFCLHLHYITNTVLLNICPSATRKGKFWGKCQCKGRFGVAHSQNLHCKCGQTITGRCIMPTFIHLTFPLNLYL